MSFTRIIVTKTVAALAKKGERLLYSNHLKLRKRAFYSTRKEGVEIVVLTWRREWRGCITHLKKRERMLLSPGVDGGEVLLT